MTFQSVREAALPAPPPHPPHPLSPEALPPPGVCGLAELWTSRGPPCGARARQAAAMGAGSGPTRPVPQSLCGGSCPLCWLEGNPWRSPVYQERAPRGSGPEGSAS